MRILDIISLCNRAVTIKNVREGLLVRIVSNLDYYCRFRNKTEAKNIKNLQVGKVNYICFDHTHISYSGGAGLVIIYKDGSSVGAVDIADLDLV